MYDVRNPVVDDAERLGDIHTRAWQFAYRGMMPDSYLDGLDPQERITMWRNGLRDGGRVDVVRRVAANLESGLVDGFVLAGPARHDEQIGEVYAIYVDPGVIGTGTGGLLFDTATSALKAAGFTEAILWVHPDNTRGRGFYEHKGWAPDGATRSEELMGVTAPEVRYRGIL